MKVEELIEALSLDAAPVRRVEPRLAAAAAAGALAALALVAAWLGFRPDLGQAMGGRMFWMKGGYTLLLAIGGFLAAERLARPAGSGRRGAALAATTFLLLALAAAVQWMGAPPEARSALLMGTSWSRCPTNILLLAVPALGAILWTARSLAPTRPGRAGAACGLLAGGVAATVYGLHCPEHTMPFVAVWYSLGVAGSVALGAALGPWALRWR